MGEDRFTAPPADAGTPLGDAHAAFLYVMYALLLCALPMAATAAASPAAAAAMTGALAAYLAAIPEPLYTLFGTGYLGYTVAREWGKAQAPRAPGSPE
jgi:hypothetical protein